MRVKQAQKWTGKAAPRTIRKRSHSLTNVRLAVSAGDSVTQLAHELHNCSRADRGEVLDELRRVDGYFLVQVHADTSLALKADLNIPWNRLRVMKSKTSFYIKTFDKWITIY